MDDKFTLGAHNARLDGIDARLSGIESKLEVLVLASERRKGAWAIVVSIASVSGAVAGLVISLIR